MSELGCIENPLGVDESVGGRKEKRKTEKGERRKKREEGTNETTKEEESLKRDKYYTLFSF